jgi:hypothetical protein
MPNPSSTTATPTTGTPATTHAERISLAGLVITLVVTNVWFFTQALSHIG